jgi:hypothetical protein
MFEIIECRFVFHRLSPLQDKSYINLLWFFSFSLKWRENPNTLRVYITSLKIYMLLVHYYSLL